MRGLRLALLVVAAASAVTTTHLTDATFTSTTTSGVSTVSAAADWTPPQVTLIVPGSALSETVPLSGTVVMVASASDPEGTPTTIRIDISPAGSGQWGELCTSLTSPVSCSWDTTIVQDSQYDIRATATDSSQNAAVETIGGVVVDNAP